MLVSVRGIARYVHTVGTLVTRLLAIAGAYHVPLQVTLLRVIVGTAQTLIRSYVPRTIRIPRISCNTQTTIACPICQCESVKSQRDSLNVAIQITQEKFDMEKFCFLKNMTLFIKEKEKTLINSRRVNITQRWKIKMKMFIHFYKYDINPYF